MEFVTSIQKASEWGVTKRMVNYWCSLGKIDGAVKDLSLIHISEPTRH